MFDWDQLKYDQLEAYQKVIKPLSKTYHPKVILCFYMPKVASTFLFNVLKELTSFKSYALSWGYLQNEQNIDFTEICKIVDQPYMSRLVAKATVANIILLICFRLNLLLLHDPLLI